jgi:hypothetical protein
VVGEVFGAEKQHGPREGESKRAQVVESVAGSLEEHYGAPEEKWPEEAAFAAEADYDERDSHVHNTHDERGVRNDGDDGDIEQLVDAVVEFLNSLGLLDDKPGVEVDYGRLVPAAINLFTMLASIAGAIVERLDERN